MPLAANKLLLAGDALALLQDWRPDVLVSDIDMPGEDGYSLIRRVRLLDDDKGGRTPAVALTAYGRTEDRVRTLSAGYSMHIPKPIDPEEFTTIVAGVALGFLPWNFYPAKIFMGDSGALLLGLLMAVATISGVGQNLEGPSGGDLAAIAIPIVIPLLVLAVPLLDVVLAIVRRMDVSGTRSTSSATRTGSAGAGSAAAAGSASGAAVRSSMSSATIRPSGRIATIAICALPSGALRTV